MFSQSAKQEELEARRQELRLEIQKIARLRAENQSKEKSQINLIQNFKYKIKVLDNLIKVTNQQTNLITRDINYNLRKITSLRDELKVLKEDYAAMMVKSYKSKNQQSRIMFLLSAEDFKQAYKRLQYMKQYTDHQKQQGETIKVKTAELQAVNLDLLKQQETKKKLIVENREVQKTLEGERKQHEELMKAIKKNLSVYAAQIKQKQQEADRIDAEIDRIIKEAIAKSNKKAGNTNVASASNFALTAEEKLLAASFVSNKGKTLRENVEDGDNLPCWYQLLRGQWIKSEEKKADGEKINSNTKCDELTFADFTANMIDQIINIQVYPDDVLTRTLNTLIDNSLDDAANAERESYMNAPSDLSFEEVTMLSDFKAWVLERRSADIGSEWAWEQEDTYDEYMRNTEHNIKVADYAIDCISSTAYFILDKVMEYNKKTYISNDDFDIVKAKIKRDGLVLGNDTPVTVHYIKALGEDTWNKLRTQDTEKRIAYYEFHVSCEIDFGVNGKSRKVAVEYKGTAAKGQRRQAMAQGLIGEYEKLIGGAGSFIGDVAKALLVQSNPWPLVSGLMNNIKSLDFERRQNEKAHKDAKKAKEMRGFNRAADCMGMVATVQKAALAYTKAGYSVTTAGLTPLNDNITTAE